MNTNLNFYCFSIIMLAGFLAGKVQAQTIHQWLLDGNSSYEEKNYDKAAATYEKVIQQDKNSVKGQYNLGNTRYKQKEFDKAIKHYKDAVREAGSEDVKARAYHNLGNAHYKKEEFKEAVEAYKNSLRINPNDVETKHNMAQALKIIRKNQPPPPPPQDNENKDQQEENQPPPPNEMSKDEVDRMLENIDQEDKKTQEEKKRQPSHRRPPEKDW